MSIARQMVDHANRLDHKMDKIYKTDDNKLVFVYGDAKAIVQKEEFFLEVLRGILPFASSSNANAVFNNLLIRAQLIPGSVETECRFEIEEQKINKTYKSIANIDGFLEPAEIFTDLTREQLIAIYVMLHEKVKNGIDFKEAESSLYDRVIYILAKVGFF